MRFDKRRCGAGDICVPGGPTSMVALAGASAVWRRKLKLKAYFESGS